MTTQARTHSLPGFIHFPVLETKRLHLRRIKPSDAAIIFAMRKNHRINKFILRSEMSSLDDARTLVKKVTKMYQLKNGIGWAGIHKEKKEFIGTCGFNSIDYDNFRAEIGGEMLVDYWGRLLAHEALNTIIDYGFTHMHLHSIEAKVIPDNKSAVHLLTSIGFEKEAHFRDRAYFDGAFHDLAVYSLFNA